MKSGLCDEDSVRSESAEAELKIAVPSFVQFDKVCRHGGGESHGFRDRNTCSRPSNPNQLCQSSLLVAGNRDHLNRVDADGSLDMGL